MISSGSGGGGGGSKKWLWIAVAGGGAAAAAVALAGRNHPPIAGTVSVSPTGTGIPGVTNMTFTSQGASDPDGDALSFSWNFGDGASGTGATASHVFPNAGTFNVTLTVSDGHKADVKAPDVPVTMRSLNGTWSSNNQGTIRTWTLSQSGTSVSGTYTSNGAPGTPGSVSGSMTSPRAFSGTSMLVGFIPFRFAGDFDTSISTLTVVANDSGFNNTTLVFNRQ